MFFLLLNERNKEEYMSLMVKLKYLDLNLFDIYHCHVFIKYILSSILHPKSEKSSKNDIYLNGSQF